MWVEDVESFIADENASLAIREAISLMVGAPMEYISVTVSATSADPYNTTGLASRRLEEDEEEDLGLERRLAAGAVRVEYTIGLPFDAMSATEIKPAGVASIQDLLAALSSPTVMATFSAYLANSLSTRTGAAAAMGSPTILGITDPVLSMITVTSTTTTTVPCGDGIRQSYELNPERCDDGNANSGDGCDSECFVEYGWYCDFQGEPCTTLCGDGRAAGVETCDDGNTLPCDGCSPTCHLEPGLCWQQAQALCAHGYVPRLDIQRCGFCLAARCRPSECCRLVRRAAPEAVFGDGVRDGEEAMGGRCDDGNVLSGDGCDADGFVEFGWSCGNGGQPCRSICGDGILAVPSEDCDDGNNEDYDGCSSACRWEHGRCAVQAAALCTGGYIARTDIPRLQFCSGRHCTTTECCAVSLGDRCPAAVGINPVTACTEGFSRPRVLAGEPQACFGYQCPAGWHHAGDRGDGSVLCEDAMCRLRTCCSTSSTSCTCGRPACCAAAGRAPPTIYGRGSPLLDGIGASGGLALSLERKLAPTPTHWYYYLTSGVVSLDTLRIALGDDLLSEVMGYVVSVPSKADLAAALSFGNFEVGAHGVPSADPVPFWSSSEALDGSVWAVERSPGLPLRPFMATSGQELYVLFEVSEAFSVVHGTSRLRRVLIEEYTPCCFTEEAHPFQGIPPALIGITAVIFEGRSVDSAAASAGRFTVVTAIPMVLYALDVIDPHNKFGSRYKQGFEELEGSGWERVSVPQLRLQPLDVPSPDSVSQPWHLPVGCWRRLLNPGVPLEVPHGPGLFGALAMSAAPPL